MRNILLLSGALVVTALLAATASADSPKPKTLTQLDLSQPFHTKTKWQFEIRQAAPAPQYDEPDDEPGHLSFCFINKTQTKCEETSFNTFENATIVPLSSPTASTIGLVVHVAEATGLASQPDFTIIWTYGSKGRADGFHQIFEAEENAGKTRLIENGPLASDIIVSNPIYGDQDGHWSPHHYTISVYRLFGTDAPRYGRILQYKTVRKYSLECDSAECESDVITTEMPRIESRLQSLHRPVR